MEDILVLDLSDDELMGHIIPKDENSLKKEKKTRKFRTKAREAYLERT